jgi:signal transduction histidine kinase
MGFRGKKLTRVIDRHVRHNRLRDLVKQLILVVPFVERFDFGSVPAVGAEGTQEGSDETRGARVPERDFQSSMDASKNLAFAMCHEISNLVAAVRLQAHLLDEELDARGLAVSSLVIDDLSARSAALLALIRPVLSEVVEPSTSSEFDSNFKSGSGCLGISPILAGVIAHGFERALAEHGGRGIEIEFDIEDDLPEVLVDSEVLHYILLMHAYGAMEAMENGGTIRVEVVAREKEVVFAIEDRAPEDPDLVQWRGASRRGRALECAVADHILAKRGARFDVSRHGDSNRTEICPPRS